MAEFYSKSARLEDAIAAKQQQQAEQRGHTDRKFAEQRVNTKNDVAEIVTECLDKRFGSVDEEEGKTARDIYFMRKTHFMEISAHLARSKSVMQEEDLRKQLSAEGMTSEEVKLKLGRRQQQS